MRKEATRFLEARDPQTAARFYAALGIELSVLARVAVRDNRADVAKLNAVNEMHHCVLGQVSAVLHGYGDFFPSDAAMSILYHYAGMAGVAAEMEQAMARAMKLALQPLNETLPPKADERRVLVVDDSPTLRSRIHRLLTGQGLVVFEAETGAEALDKAAWVEPHLTIVDWRMPVLDGPDFIAKFKRSDQGQRSRVLLLVQGRRAPSLAPAVKPLVNATVARPFKNAELVSQALRLLA
ncbi:MAG: response regulator [Planctomycetes bacterium]|nr:response regulator [Planctomycetota bacterium]